MFKSTPWKIIFLILYMNSSSYEGFCQEIEYFNIRNYTKQEYKAENQNWSVTHDGDGFIYVANNVGLLDYDGVEWNFHPSPNGTVLRSVAADDQNRIFTSGYREIGFWERDRYGILNYSSLNEIAAPLFNKNEEFWNTVICDGKVYFQSFSSIFVYDYHSFHVIKPTNLVSSVSEVNGKIYVHVSHEGIYTIQDTILVPAVTNTEIGGLIHFVRPLLDSSLLIGSQTNGLYRFKDGALSRFLPDWVEYFTENNINRGEVSENGNIIIGTLIDGVIIFDTHGNLVHKINKENGLQNNTVLGIDVDENNNIWLSLDKGIDFISYSVDPSYSYYRYDEIGAVYDASLFEGNLYLCTNQGVFYRDWDRQDQKFKIVPGTQGQTWSCEVVNDELIVGHNAGTFTIRDGQLENISRVGGGLSLIKELGNSDILIQSTYSNIVFYESINSRINYKYQLPDFNDLIRYIEIDHLDNLWASHMHRGIYKLHLNDPHDSILKIDYLSDSIFGQDYNINVFKVENRIIFTTGKEIYTYNDLTDSIVPYYILNRKLKKYAASHRVIEGTDHHYWFICKSGIALYHIFDNQFTILKEYPIDLFKEHLIIGYENIYPISDFQAVLCLDNGYAILRADKPDLSNMIMNKELFLTRVEIGGDAGTKEIMPIDEGIIRVPFKKRNLILNFSFPLFSNEEVKFQSYIKGLDKNWSTALQKPEISMDRIPPGEYTLLVRAFNNWNVSSLIGELKIIVSPPWYLNRVSIVIYSILIFLLLILSRFLLQRRIRNRERKISDTKEKELIRLRNEKLNAELSFRSQELANSTMLIIKKNEFLMNLKESVKKQKDELGMRYPDKYYHHLIRKIDNNISSMDDWKVFEFHFEKAHEKFLQKLMHKFPQLNHGDLRLCAYLRMNLTSKEIAPLLRISVRGVENHRYKLRKKLNLKTEENLTDFILEL